MSSGYQRNQSEEPSGYQRNQSEEPSGYQRNQSEEPSGYQRNQSEEPSEHSGYQRNQSLTTPSLCSSEVAVATKGTNELCCNYNNLSSRPNFLVALHIIGNFSPTTHTCTFPCSPINQPRVRTSKSGRSLVDSMWEWMRMLNLSS